MNVFFHFPINRFERNKSTYTLIRRVLLSSGLSLELDWLEKIEKSFKDKRGINSSILLKRSIEAIKNADMTIAEGTEVSFETGYLIQLAAQYKKPTLILVEEGAQIDLETEEQIKNIESEYVHVIKYFAQDLSDIIENFISSNKGDPVTRFNLMIERKQRDYLDWADRFYKHSKSEIIRELINEQIKNDVNYQRLKGNVTQKFSRKFT